MNVHNSDFESQQSPIFNLPRIIILLVGICAVVYLMQYWVAGSDWGNHALVHLAFIPIRYSQSITEPLWSYVFAPVSYAFLHGGFGHLAINMLWLVIFGSPLALRLGWQYFLIFWLVTAFAAAFMHFWVYPESYAPLVGASGAISGMTGAATRFGFRTQPYGRFRAFIGRPMTFQNIMRDRTSIVFIVVWFGMNILAGTGAFNEPNTITSIAWQAHIGGFLAGFFLLPLFLYRKR